MIISAVAVLQTTAPDLFRQTPAAGLPQTNTAMSVLMPYPILTAYLTMKQIIPKEKLSANPALTAECNTSDRYPYKTPAVTECTGHIINSRPYKIAGAAVFIYPFIRSGFRYLIPKQSLSTLLPLSVTNILSYALFTATGDAPSSYRFTIKSASISICNSLLSIPV